MYLLYILEFIICAGRAASAWLDLRHCHAHVVLEGTAIQMLRLSQPVLPFVAPVVSLSVCLSLMYSHTMLSPPPPVCHTRTNK